MDTDLWTATAATPSDWSIKPARPSGSKCTSKLNLESRTCQPTRLINWREKTQITPQETFSTTFKKEELQDGSFSSRSCLNQTDSNTSKLYNWKQKMECLWCNQSLASKRLSFGPCGKIRFEQKPWKLLLRRWTVRLLSRPLSMIFKLIFRSQESSPHSIKCYRLDCSHILTLTDTD